MSTKLFHSIYSYASKLGCDRPRKNLLEEIKNKIRKIDIFSAIYIIIKVVTTTNSKIGLQRSLQNLMLDFSKKKKSQIGQEFSSENDFEPRFSISLHCAGTGYAPRTIKISVTLSIFKILTKNITETFLYICRMNLLKKKNRFFQPETWIAPLEQNSTRNIK